MKDSRARLAKNLSNPWPEILQDGSPATTLQLYGDDCAATMRRADLTGRRFGARTVIALADSSSRGASRWGCRCDCGGAAVVRADALKNGSSKCCGTCDYRQREVLPRGYRLAKVLAGPEIAAANRVRAFAADIAKRLEGLDKAERLKALERMATEATQARQAAQARPSR
jgi:hypothetical protein